jgi:hypothetical protein
MIEELTHGLAKQFVATAISALPTFHFVTHAETNGFYITIRDAAFHYLGSMLILKTRLVLQCISDPSESRSPNPGSRWNPEVQFKFDPADPSWVPQQTINDAVTAMVNETRYAR